MTAKREILCIGSVLWDVIGRTDLAMGLGSDVPGRITRLPGGVALNIAMTLGRFGLSPILISAVGQDTEGQELVRACDEMALNTAHLYRPRDLPTDVYMAIEAKDGLVAAIADAHSLEAAGDKILAPLCDGALGNADAPYPGTIALDGNLTESLLAEIAVLPEFAKADLRVAPASPGKAARLKPLLKHSGSTLYVNLIEANTLAGDANFTTAKSAAEALVAQGTHRVLVTDGANAAAEACADYSITQTPPQVVAKRITGAGDTFMAAHIAAELAGAAADLALRQALRSAATYVSGTADI